MHLGFGLSINATDTREPAPASAAARLARVTRTATRRRLLVIWLFVGRLFNFLPSITSVSASSIATMPSSRITSGTKFETVVPDVPLPRVATAFYVSTGGNVTLAALDGGPAIQFANVP